MIILTIRTDKPDAEIGLYDSEAQLAYEVWSAHRYLAETIHTKLDQLLESQGKKLQDIDGILCYKGPGSFTGLRIGLSVANALAYSRELPIVGIEDESHWIERGLQDILAGKDEGAIFPMYGAPVHITNPKH